MLLVVLRIFIQELRLTMSKKLAVYGFYFLILISIALFVRDIPNQYGSNSVMELTLDEVIKTSEWGDPSSYGLGAVDVATTGWITSDHQVVFNAWPPGFTLLEALIIKSMGMNAPVVFILMILLAALFSLIFVILFNDWRIIKNDVISFFIPLIIFIFPLSRVYLLQPVGVSFGEPFSVAFFILGLLFLCRSVKTKKIRPAIYAGLFFALSAYFRSQFELFVLAINLLGILSFICLRKSSVFYGDKSTSFSNIILVVVITANLAMLPWRIYHLVNNGFPVWVSTPLATAKLSVQTDAELESSGRGFILAGGGNLTCKVDPTTCGKESELTKLFLKTYLENPLKWYELKLRKIGKYWFSPIVNWVTVNAQPNLFDYFINMIFLVLIMSSSILLSLSDLRKTHAGKAISWIFYSLVFAYSIIYSLVHFEVRYFYFPKIMSLIFFVLTISSYISHKQNKSVNSN